VLSLLEKAGAASAPEQDILRKELFGQFEELFHIMKTEFRQVHFHLDDGTSFLRLHKPESFGDNLRSTRESIHLIGEEKKFLNGFEMGRHFYAIRYLYPLFSKENVFLGSVEMGVSFRHFRSSLRELADGEHLLLIHSGIAEEKLLPSGKNNFQTAILGEQFVIEKGDTNEHPYVDEAHMDGHIASIILSNIDRKIKRTVRNNLPKEISFSVMAKIAGQEYLVSFLPMQNISGRDVGYLVRYSRDSTLSHLKRDYFLAYLIASLLIMFILLLYRWATNKIFSQLSLQQNLLDSIPTPIFYTDIGGKYIGSNNAFVNTFGLPGNPGGKQNTEHSEWKEIFKECITDLEVEEESGTGEKEIILSENGQKGKTYYCYKARFENPLEEELGLIGTLFDISKRKEAEKELARSHEEIQQIFNTAADGMRVVDKDHNVLLANDRFAKMCGMTKQELQSLKCYEVFGGESCMTDSCPLSQILAGEEWVESEVVKKMPNGIEISCIVTATPYRDRDGAVVGILEDFKDISDRKDLEKKLEMLSRTDELTGLLNRRGFINDADKMLRLCKRQKKDLFLIFADLDNMKTINDNLGHDTGDLALQAIATLISKDCRESDVIGRLGGDEFAILLVDVISEDEQSIVDRFQEKLNQWNKQSPEDFELLLSMGIVKAHSNNSESIEELVQRADQAMYRVKKKRKASRS
jgi:diguanylate cyclase (GGDEF)-like protein/PAS domain S-box-containing protein